MRIIFFAIMLFYNVLSNGLVAQNLDIQGHRGARGLYPENTIQGMLVALGHGVSTLEMDVVITADHQVLVSHEPFFSPEICAQPNGSQIPESHAHSLNIYKMNYDEVAKFDCGLQNHPRFKEQEKALATKPLLHDLIATVETHILQNSLMPVNYNIEIKSTPKGDAIFHPVYNEFSDLVYQEIKDLPSERIIIQSFDIRVLRYWKKRYPQYKLALLTEFGHNATAHITLLGFQPDIYSPYFKLLSKRRVKKLQNKGIKVIPWTVNEISDMQKLIQWGVDGLITDYPNRAQSLK